MLLTSMRYLQENFAHQIETILIEGKNYKSASQAYNCGLSCCQIKDKDILIFVHQDIAFKDSRFLKRIVKEFTSNENQLIGVAGMSPERKTISNLKYLNTGEYITRERVKSTTEVLSLDECMFSMTGKMYNNIRFDEKTCSHWHLYAVDFCYEAKRKYGTKSRVIPEQVFHKYDNYGGLYTDSYFLRTMWKMIRKYRKDYDMIYTPCYIISTQPLKAIIKLIKTYIKNILRNLI